MPWRRASPEYLLRSFVPPVAVALLGVAAVYFTGAQNPVALFGFGICFFVVATIAQEFVRGADARHRATGEGYLPAIVHLVQRNKRRYGGYVVHLGMILIGAGAIGSHAYQQQATLTLQPGQTAQVAGYTLTFQGLQTYNVPDAQVVETPLLLGSEVLRPQKVFFKNFEQQPSTKVAIRSSLVEDLYIVVSGWTSTAADARVTMVVFVNPLVGWIWVGGLFVLAGTMIALWPAARVALRPAPVPAPRGALGVAS
jgi:cytochrome c-type biogenesis protein CcmF